MERFGTITIADVSMSIDNVFAVAAIAREDTGLLVFGLALAIVFMAFFATVIMKVMTKYPWLCWAGLVFLIYLSFEFYFRICKMQFYLSLFRMSVTSICDIFANSIFQCFVLVFQSYHFFETRKQYYSTQRSLH